MKETVERAVRVRIRSVQYDYREFLSARIARLEERVEAAVRAAEETGEDPEAVSEELYNESACGDAGMPYEMVTEGRIRTRGGLCELSYMERDEDGNEDTRSTLVFSNKRPNVITLTRSGLMRMTLSFEEGRHHIGSYTLGAMQRLISDKPSVVIASYARTVDNRILEEGVLNLDYLIEVRGMDTQRTVFTLLIDELPLVPTGFSGGEA